MDGPLVRILWLSNPPWIGSGYGQQTALFVPKLAALGHDIAVASNYGFHDAQLHWNGIKCYPADGVYGNRTLAAYAQDFGADQVIALCDAWVLHPDEWGDGPPVAVWAPVDHTPLPAMVRAPLAHPRVRPIAMSWFGEQMMRDAGLEPLYVPHGIDTDLFRPRPELRDEARGRLGVPHDAFLAGMVAANVGNSDVPRKNFPNVFTALARFMAAHPDAWFYCHSEGNPRPGAGGTNLYELAERRGLPSDRIRIPADNAWHLGIPAEFLALTVYPALDVLLLPSMGEGFGIPLIEAQACGVPVIASDHSAMTELAQNGWLVGGDPWDDRLMKADFILPPVGAITEALEHAHEARDDQVLRAAAAEFAQGYDADLIVDTYWRPALAELTSGPVPLNRAQRRAARKQKALA
jgi:glycosyltransferase involved in cell wall biosynthesis